MTFARVVQPVIGGFQVSYSGDNRRIGAESEQHADQIAVALNEAFEAGRDAYIDDLHKMLNIKVNR